jgi:tetratricopeptide (TPR) repeat protein
MMHLAPVLLTILVSASNLLAFQDDGVGLRIIVVGSESEARNLRARAVAGERFDQLAAAHSTDVSAASGGYIGTVSTSDLSSGYQNALSGLAPGQISPVAQVGGEYVLLQPLDSGESNWLEHTEAGLRALDLGRVDEAEVRLAEALEQAREFGPADYRLNLSLNTLGGIHRLRGNFDEAARLYRAALEVTQRAVGPNHPDLAASLATLGRLYQEQGAYTEAEAAFGRAQAILVDAFGPNHPNVAMGLNDLARLRHSMGNFARAESLYQVALSILEQASGPNDSVVAQTLDELAALLREMGRDADAAQVEARGASIRDGQ